MDAARPQAACADRVLDALLFRLEGVPGFSALLANLGEQEETDLVIELKREIERVLDGG